MMKEVAIQLDECIAEYEALLAEYNASLTWLKDTHDKIQNRIKAEEDKTAGRINTLETKLWNTPREELRRINKQLEDNAVMRQSPSIYWENQYAALGGGAPMRRLLSEKEAHALESRREKLEHEAQLVPFSKEEQELYALRSVEHSITDTERQKLREGIEDAEESYKELQACKRSLLDSIAALEKELKSVKSAYSEERLKNLERSHNKAILKFETAAYH